MAARPLHLIVPCLTILLMGAACSLQDNSALSGGGSGDAGGGDSGGVGGSGGNAGSGAVSGSAGDAGAAGSTGGAGGTSGAGGAAGSASVAPRGAACEGHGDCESGHCVDGVCCDTACDGTCVACSAERTGSGVDGTCAPIAAGTDPDSECLDQGSASCGTRGDCDGAGACQLYPAATVCAPSSCSEAERTLPSLCDGSGSCVPGGTQACEQGNCDGDVCLGQCSHDSQCSADRFCGLVSATCEPQLDSGEACERSAQCSSGHCAQGVCCDSACSGTCESCLAAHKASGASGTCGPIKINTDPLSQCEEAGAASCGTTGQCDGSGGCRLYPSGTVCEAGTCLEGAQYQQPRTCNGLGSCGLPGISHCEPFQCGSSGCYERCDGDSQCHQGYVCDVSEGRCIRPQSLGRECTKDVQCSSRKCVEGVCCDDACEGACFSCKTGGKVGRCSPTKDCTTPDCPGACTKSGYCDLTQACF